LAAVRLRQTNKHIIEEKRDKQTNKQTNKQTQTTTIENRLRKIDDRGPIHTKKNKKSKQQKHKNIYTCQCWQAFCRKKG
jgi:uncharacterized membrane protein